MKEILFKILPIFSRDEYGRVVFFEPPSALDIAHAKHLNGIGERRHIVRALEREPIDELAEFLQAVAFPFIRHNPAPSLLRAARYGGQAC